MNVTRVQQTTERHRNPLAHLPETERYHLLSNDRRRHVLDALAGVDGTMDARRLAERVGELSEPGGGDVDVEAILLALHHVHLPKLADADVVTYDPETRDVAPVAHNDD